MKIEQRNVTLSANTEESMTIECLVNPVGQWSKMLGNKRQFKEKIECGVFAKAIEDAQTEGRNIDLLFNHNSNGFILASTRNGSLELFEDSEGLKIRAELIDEQVYKQVRSGLLSECSFGFIPLDEEWGTEDGVRTRTIKALKLVECTICYNGAYNTTQAKAVRSLDEIAPDEVDYEELRRSLFANLTAE